MSITKEHLTLVERIGPLLPLPEVAEILLPRLNPDSMRQDEFGFVVLADGSVGPFYTRLGITLELLYEIAAPSRLQGVDALSLAMGIGDGDLYQNALALGAFNAISQHLMKRAGFDPARHAAPPFEPVEGRVGMVGFFRPLIERYLARGLKVLVIELRPERVPPELGVEVSTSPRALAGCDTVICTASTLINNSLDSILQAVAAETVVNLMGPSASGLPDLLFSRGVDWVGGVVIEDLPGLRDALAEDRSWGECGRKYQLSAADYPGLDHLLERIIRKR